MKNIRKPLIVLSFLFEVVSHTDINLSDKGQRPAFYTNRGWT